MLQIIAQYQPTITLSLRIFGAGPPAALPTFRSQGRCLMQRYEWRRRTTLTVAAQHAVPAKCLPAIHPARTNPICPTYSFANTLRTQEIQK